VTEAIMTRRLAHLVARAERDLRKVTEGWREFAQALGEIKDSGAYREKYSSWEAYVRERWGLSDVHATQMIFSARVIAEVEASPTRLGKM
jgi:hypothetical protein